MRPVLLGAVVFVALLGGCATEGPYNGYYNGYAYDYGYYGPSYYDYGYYGPGYYYGPEYFGFSYYGGDGGQRWHHGDGDSRSFHRGSVRTRPGSSSHTVTQARTRSNHLAQRSTTVQRASSAHTRRSASRRDDARRDRAERNSNRVAMQRGPDRDHGG